MPYVRCDDPLVPGQFSCMYGVDPDPGRPACGHPTHRKGAEHDYYEGWEEVDG
jgi:hypothetical protein